MQETLVQSLGWEDPLEEIATTPVFLPRKSHGQEEPGMLESMGLQSQTRLSMPMQGTWVRFLLQDSTCCGAGGKRNSSHLTEWETEAQK